MFVSCLPFGGTAVGGVCTVVGVSASWREKVQGCDFSDAYWDLRCHFMCGGRLDIRGIPLLRRAGVNGSSGGVVVGPWFIYCRSIGRWP